MKTFGLFMLLQLCCIIFMALLLPDAFSVGEKMITGILEAWCMYKLIKEHGKE